MEWEGNGVLELVEEPLPVQPTESSKPSKPSKPARQSVQPELPPEPSSDEESIGSGDEYVEDAKADPSSKARRKVL